VQLCRCSRAATTLQRCKRLQGLRPRAAAREKLPILKQRK
jgi:hypothetical protein